MNNKFMPRLCPLFASKQACSAPYCDRYYCELCMWRSNEGRDHMSKEEE